MYLGRKHWIFPLLLTFEANFGAKKKLPDKKDLASYCIHFQSIYLKMNGWPSGGARDKHISWKSHALSYCCRCQQKQLSTLKTSRSWEAGRGENNSTGDTGSGDITLKMWYFLFHNIDILVQFGWNLQQNSRYFSAMAVSDFPLNRSEGSQNPCWDRLLVVTMVEPNHPPIQFSWNGVGQDCFTWWFGCKMWE